ncbi:MAG: hypothetical protein IPJ13_24815 [Saprospiraceae bacterium]|nr:hypothetical protein [Saprospiraceae bacterium]
MVNNQTEYLSKIYTKYFLNILLLKAKGITLSGDSESLVAVIFLLLDEIQRRDEIIERQNNEIMASRAEVSELKSRLNQNSNNSHKPPSSDPYWKAATPRKKGGKRGGKRRSPRQRNGQATI